MFDDLRKDGDDSPFFQGGGDVEPLLDAPKKRRGGSGKKNRKFLGMTAFQRFFISALFMMMVCVMGVATLLLTNTISLPFQF